MKRKFNSALNWAANCAANWGANCAANWTGKYRAASKTALSLGLYLLAFSGCQQPKVERPNIIIIAVENLGFESIGCGGLADYSGQPVANGFEHLCRDSIRFTHAYTPSTMSQAALTSLLTGLFPFEHNVVHNGANFLSSQVETVPERAVHLGMRTSFFSGGPPIFRNSGLAQGFELFEDHTPVGWNQFYRPARESLKLAQDWIVQEVGKDSFLSVVYLADLQFPFVETRTDSGEIRSKTYESQIQEIGESLNTFFIHLKKLKKWDNTYIVLAGLNGPTQEKRAEELSVNNVWTERTLVSLFVKPARKARDVGLEWTVDANVSLVDVGVTFFDLLGGSNNRRKSDIVRISLKGALTTPKVAWPNERWIPISSGWAEWRANGESRYAFRKGSYMVLWDSDPKVYNSLIDRYEVLPLVSQDFTSQQLIAEVEGIGEALGISRWKAMDRSLVQKHLLGRYFFANHENLSSESELLDLVRLRKKDSQLRGWRAWQSLQARDWFRLLEIGRENKNLMWQWVAHANLKTSMKLKLPVCQEVFLGQKISDENPIECPDEIVLLAARWLTSSDEKMREAFREEFLASYRLLKLKERMSQYNYITGFVWDTNLDSPGEPLWIDLYLNLPDKKSALSQAQQMVRARP